MKNKILVMSVLCMLLLCSGCKKDVKLKNGKEVIASIKGKDFTAEELFADLKEQYGSSSLINMVDNYITDKEVKNTEEATEYGKAQVEQMKKQYAESGYDWNTILNQYGFSSDKDLIKEYALSYRKKEVVNKYLKEKVSNDEINEYYEKEIYGNYTVKHILIAPDTDDNASDEDKEKAKNKAKSTAEEVIEKLNNGSEWKDLVKEYSDDTGSKENEGLIENFTKGDVVDEFFEATLKLKNKEYTKEPVESTYGYHIILKVSNTKKPSLNKAKETVLNKIVENKLANDENLYDNTWVEVRNKYNLNITDSTIKKGYNKTISG